MDTPNSYTTRLSLLGRLKNTPDDQASWSEFVARYEPMIQRWCRGYGLQPSDAHDVAQNVLLKIARQMKKFEYKPGGRFRSWLKTVVHHAWVDFIESQKWKGSGDDNVHRLLQSVEARDNLLERIEQEYDQQLLDEAISAVKKRVEPHIWQAFELMGLKRRSAKETAQRLTISEGNAYVCKSRVQKMLTDEITRLEKIMET